jgi:hypothetical protein
MFSKISSFCYVYEGFVGLSHSSLILYNSFINYGLYCLSHQFLLRLFHVKISNILQTVELIVQLNFQRTPSKEADPTKESSRPERPSVFTKRSTPAATIHIQSKKPTSSVDAQIIGGSASSSQFILKQEVSMALSKGSTLKTGMLLCS